MKDFLEVLKPFVIIVGVIVVGVFGVVAFAVGETNGQTQSNWCTYKNGVYGGAATGNYWLGNPLTLGMTGRCVEGQR